MGYSGCRVQSYATDIVADSHHELGLLQMGQERVHAVGDDVTAGQHINRA